MIIKPTVVGVPLIPNPDIPRIMNDNGGIVPPWLLPVAPTSPKK